MTTTDFLKTYPEHLCEIVGYQRDLIRSTLPDVIEKVIIGWRVIGYRIQSERKSIYFCCIAPQKKENDVLLGFEYGIAMRDPKKIMEGKGTQVRFVRMRQKDQHPEEDLIWLIEEAARIAIEFRSGHQSSLYNPAYKKSPSKR
jgi:hypothetical protein